MKTKAQSLLSVCFAILSIIAIACTSAAPAAPSESTPDPAPTSDATLDTNRLRVATTTSLYDTGLWEVLEPKFEEERGIQLDVISGGTGRALELGTRGDVDVLTIHDKSREQQFVADGYGTERNVVAYNYFVIIGPDSDPAGIARLSPEDAFTKLRNEGLAGTPGAEFVSRGDDSGTHGKEKAIWGLAGFDYEEIRSSGAWYVEAGSGMGATLVLANEKGVYTLSDIGTFLAYQGDLDLVPLVTEGGALLNVYSVIPVNPDTHENIDAEGAQELVDFLTSDEVQDIIDSYGVDEYGTQLFHAARGVEPTQ